MINASIVKTITDSVTAMWSIANGKNDAIVERVLGAKIDDVPKAVQRRYFSTNEKALAAFINRKVEGLNLSDRVWKYTDQFKEEIEMALDLGIREGKSAAAMSLDVRQYLQSPDMLFRRVRDEHGLLQLSQRAKAYHPGQGVYRSSYKNARRLTATETNIAYRTADFLRYQQMDFVVGIQICLSNNHTVLLQPGETTADPEQLRADGSPKANAVKHLVDICDELQGRYPKDFKFTGWHSHCRCHVITILKSKDEIKQDLKRLANGEDVENTSVNEVTELPPNFETWIKNNEARIKNRPTLPYFIKDNQKQVNGILDIEPSDKKSSKKDQNYKPFKMTSKELQDLIQRGLVNSSITVEQWQSSPVNGLNPNNLIIEIENKANSIGSNVTLFKIENDLKSKHSFIRLGGNGWICSREFYQDINGALNVIHEIFDIDNEFQGKGLSKVVLRTFYKEYRAMGIKNIVIHANITVGGYAWARYGFQAKSRDEVKNAVRWELLNSTQSNSIQHVIDEWYLTRPNDSPFPMNKIANLPYGRIALLGGSWIGYIDLQNSTQRMVFEKYLGI